MGKIKKIKQKYRSILRSSRDKENRNRLRNENITIISANCVGGVIYHDLGLKFNSPTVNLYFNASDYVKFVSNLTYYLQCELKEIDRVFLYKDFFFLITNEKKLLVLKTVGVETEELIKIIKEADILFEKREEPFNIYEYCKKQ